MYRFVVWVSIVGSIAFVVGVALWAIDHHGAGLPIALIGVSAAFLALQGVVRLRRAQLEAADFELQAGTAPDDSDDDDPTNG